MANTKSSKKVEKCECGKECKCANCGCRNDALPICFLACVLTAVLVALTFAISFTVIFDYSLKHKYGRQFMGQFATELQNMEEGEMLSIGAGSVIDFYESGQTGFIYASSDGCTGCVSFEERLTEVAGNNGVLANVSHLIPYITGQIDDKRIVKPVYFEQDPIPQKDSEVLHSIIIKGDSREKLLYAYIELFDFYKVLVLLNENYSDDSVEFSYFFDVISRKEVFKGYQLDLTRMDVERIMSGILPYKDILQHLNVLLEKTLRKQDSEHRKMLLTEAMNNVMKKYPEKKYFDEEMREDIVNETMKQLTPWLLHRLRLNKS